MQHELLTTLSSARDAAGPHLTTIGFGVLALIAVVALWAWAGASGRARRYLSERDTYGSALDAANAKAEKFKQQVHDTCARAEKAEGALEKSNLRVAELKIENAELRDFKAGIQRQRSEAGKKGNAARQASRTTKSKSGRAPSRKRG